MTDNDPVRKLRKKARFWRQHSLAVALLTGLLAPAVLGLAANPAAADEQVGSATSPWPERACLAARNETEGYALDQYAVTNDGGCSCRREQLPDWDERTPGWSCQVRVLYDLSEAVSGREVKVGTGTGASRDLACAAAEYSSTLRAGSWSWRSARDTGCYCPVEGYEKPLGSSSGREWYCERIIRYYQ